MGDPSEFKSFRDLLRSKDASAEAPEATQSEGSWTLESEQRVGGADAGVGAQGETVDSRVMGRPAAFGAMQHGPPPYRDMESDEMHLLASFRVRTVFPKDVERETSHLPADPRPEDWADREDLRGETIFTIDGADAKDFDDAISIKPLGNGDVELGVHIADVSHYVRPGSALDDEALARGTSVYLADQVVPMLPESLSNGLCSLVEGRDRLAFSVFMTFTEAGERTATRVGKSVIRSVRRNTYAEVQALLDGEPGLPQSLIELEPHLRRFESWTRTQQKIRDAKGSLRIQSKETKFVFDENHEVKGVVEDARYFSNALIEETALAANQAVGDHFHVRGLPTIFRVHPEKDPEEIEEVSKMLLEYGLRVPEKERLTGRDIGRLIRAARNKANADVLIQRIMGLVERAFYEVRDSEDVAEHFGLARKAYLHFTSPIRRYPDLIVHRWLWQVEQHGRDAEAELKTGELVEDLNRMAAHSSIRSDVAVMAEQAVNDLKVCQYLEPHIGERAEARVQRVSRGGMQVFLTDYGVSGFLPMRSLGDRPRLKGPSLQVRSGKYVLSFTEGSAIQVLISDVDFLRLTVMLTLGK